MAIHAPIVGAPLRAIPLPPNLAFIMGVPVAPREAIERAIQCAIDGEDDGRRLPVPAYGFNQSLASVGEFGA